MLLCVAVGGRGCQGAGEFREQRPDAKTAKLQARDLCSQRYPSEDNAPSLSTTVEGERRLCGANSLVQSVCYSYLVTSYSVPGQTLNQRASASWAL